MVKLSLLAASLVASSSLAAPSGPMTRTQAENELEARQGYYFQNWSEGGSNVRCQNGGGGSYTVSWNSKGGFVCGKGWSYGGSRTIRYTGTYNATGPGYLAIYGWTRNPLIEYYIIESHADLAPNEPWTSKGNFSVDGEGDYEVFTSTRVNKPSIEGTRTFQQYWSVRKEKRVGGTVTTQKHFDQWNKLGMRLGNHDYVILATEGYTANGGPGSSGQASLTLQ
uniref:Endo-1,4-beta-xylanase n=1 Tax=Achaetomium sp. Xz-8 TaxID=1351709 RepID=V9XY37_9PEZI|nr:endo-1,4-beta-xylanase B [Achaetomium sp. Xz-8]